MLQPLFSTKKNRNLIIGLILLLALSFLGSTVYHTHHQLATVTSQLPIKAELNQTTEIPIFIDTKEATINAAEVYLRYDPSDLTVTDVTKTGSFFQLWIDNQPNLSTSTNTISFAGGLPQPGFKGKGQVGTIKFIGKKRGRSLLTFTDKTRVLLNDGQGTALTLTLSPIPITVK